MKGLKWRVKALLDYLRFHGQIFKADRGAARNGVSIAKTPICFVAGCGRSGTTLLGRLLSLHPEIVYLNEPRPFWIAISRRTEIWGYCRPARSLQSLLMEELLDGEGSRFAALFAKASVGSRLLVEKTPENVFRLPWLHGMAPDAKLIHIVRNGYDVIRSILVEADFDIPYGLCDMNNWYGTQERKKILLSQTALQLGIASSIVNSCISPADWAALEWVCSLRAFEKNKQLFASSGVFELCYEELTQNTWEIYSDLLKFLNLSESESLQKKIMAYVCPRKPSAAKPDLALGLREIFEAEQVRLGYL